MTKQGRGAYSAPMPPVVGFRGQMRSMEERVKQGCRDVGAMPGGQGKRRRSVKWSATTRGGGGGGLTLVALRPRSAD